MKHILRLIPDPSLFFYVSWVCSCGHRCTSWQDYDAHVADAVAVTHQ